MRGRKGMKRNNIGEKGVFPASSLSEMWKQMPVC